MPRSPAMCHHRDWAAAREDVRDLESEPTDAADDAEPEPELEDEVDGPHRLPPIQPSD